MLPTIHIPNRGPAKYFRREDGYHLDPSREIEMQEIITRMRPLFIIRERFQKEIMEGIKYQIGNMLQNYHAQSGTYSESRIDIRGWELSVRFRNNNPYQEYWIIRDMSPTLDEKIDGLYEQALWNLRLAVDELYEKALKQSKWSNQ